MTVADVAATCSSHASHVAGRAVLGVAWLATLGGMGDPATPRSSTPELIAACGERQGDIKSTRHGLACDRQNKMAEQVAKTGRKPPPSRAGKGPTPSSWKPGQSGNPGGRPRKAFAACEAVRDDVDPHEWVAAELEVARDVTKTWEVRRDAWRSLIDRGFVKPPVGLDATVTSGNAPDRDFSHLSPDRIRALIAELDGDDSLDTERPRHEDDSDNASDVSSIDKTPTVPQTVGALETP